MSNYKSGKGIDSYVGAILDRIGKEALCEASISAKIRRNISDKGTVRE